MGYSWINRGASQNNGAVSANFGGALAKVSGEIFHLRAPPAHDIGGLAPGDYPHNFLISSPSSEDKRCCLVASKHSSRVPPTRWRNFVNSQLVQDSYRQRPWLTALWPHLHILCTILILPIAPLGLHLIRHRTNHPLAKTMALSQAPPTSPCARPPYQGTSIPSTSTSQYPQTESTAASLSPQSHSSKAGKLMRQTCAHSKII